MEEKKFNPHEIEWTKEKIFNFWNYYVSNEALSEISVAKENGCEIVKLVRKYLKKDGNNLDYGCGAGYLMEYLFEAGISCAGLDYSDKSLADVKKKFKGNNLFKGVILSSDTPNKEIADNSYAFIFLIETIEHISPNKLKSFLDELFRIIKHGGYLFISTRNDENLDQKKIICPDCGAIFHRVQHISSFNAKSINKLMNEVGFQTIFSKGILLGRTKNIFERIKYAINFLISKMTDGKFFRPNLVYLGRK